MIADAYAPGGGHLNDELVARRGREAFTLRSSRVWDAFAPELLKGADDLAGSSSLNHRLTTDDADM